MQPLSILMFIFAGMLLVYAGLLAVTKDINLLPIRTRVTIKKKGRKQYLFKLSKCIALAALAPALGGVVGFWSEVGVLITFAVVLVAALWLSARIMKDEL